MNRFQITIISVLILVMFSCNKSETKERISIYGKWEVNCFMSVESVLYQVKDGFFPEMEFKTDGSYYLKLEMNSCLGNFTLSGNDQISISDSGCTKICCDSDFSKKFVQLLPQVQSFQFENNILKLEVPEWGWIELVSDN